LEGSTGQTFPLPETVVSESGLIYRARDLWESIQKHDNHKRGKEENIFLRTIRKKQSRQRTNKRRHRCSCEGGFRRKDVNTKGAKKRACCLSNSGFTPPKGRSIKRAQTQAYQGAQGTGGGGSVLERVWERGNRPGFPKQEPIQKETHTPQLSNKGWKRRNRGYDSGFQVVGMDRRKPRLASTSFFGGAPKGGKSTHSQSVKKRDRWTTSPFAGWDRRQKGRPGSSRYCQDEEKKNGQSPGKSAVWFEGKEKGTHHMVQ